jgi:hypothetical protein
MLNTNNTWYQKNKEKCAESDKHHSSKSEYQESHKKPQRLYKSRTNVKFPPNPPSIELCHNIVSDFCADTSP